MNQRATISPPCISPSRFVNDICDGSPNTEGIFLRHPNLRIARIGWYEPSLLPSPLKPFEGIFAIQFTDGDFSRRRISVTLIHDDDVAIIDVSVNHRVALHSDEIACLRIGAEHSEQLNILSFLIIVERNGESRHNIHIEEWQAHIP